MCVVFFFKQKTAYEMRISDWSSDVCSSDLDIRFGTERQRQHNAFRPTLRGHLPRLCPARTLWPNHPVQRLLVWRRHDLDTGKVDYLEHLPPPPRSRAERCVRTHGDPECPDRQGWGPVPPARALPPLPESAFRTRRCLAAYGRFRTDEQ